MKNKELWDSIKREKEFQRSRLKRLFEPCKTCGRMPDEHPYCNCLVMYCCGYRIDSRCPDYEISEDPDMKKCSCGNYYMMTNNYADIGWCGLCKRPTSSAS